MVLPVMIREEEVYEEADSVSSLVYAKNASSSGHTGPRQDTGVHLLGNSGLVVGISTGRVLKVCVFKMLFGSMSLILCIILRTRGSSSCTSFRNTLGNMATMSGTSCGLVLADLDSFNPLLQETLTVYLED